jgi:hypothetical protein
MGQTRGPSTRASGLDKRWAHVQADETHAILALADIIAKGNVHFGASTKTSCTAQAVAK